MKAKINRSIALLLCLALAMTLLPAAALAVDTTRVYCQVPEGWENCKVYWWGGSGESYQWPGVDMQLSEGRIWGYDVPSDAEGIIFTNGEGQKTANLKVPTDDKVMYVYEHYFWGVYGQEEIEELYIVAGVSALCGSDWDPTDQNNRMTDEDGDGIYTKLYPEVAPGTYHLKVTVGSWSKSWGDPVSGANYTLEVPQEGLDVVVYFDTATQTMGTEFRGDHIPTPDFDYAISIRVTGYDDSPVTLKLAGPYTTRTFTIESPWVCLCDEIAAGEYTLTFSKKNHVDRVYALTVTDQSVSLDAVLNLLGDVNEDGEISIGDVARLYAHVRENALLTDYALACADFNQDGQVDVGDTGSLYAFVRGVGSTEKPEEPEIPEEPEVPEIPEDPPVSGVYVVGQDALPYTDEEIYQQLFDPESKIEIDLDMSDKELQKLQDDYERYRNMGSKSPIYRLGNMTITITTKQGAVSYLIKEVGARMKGNTSRTSFYNAQEGIYKYIHFKFDFQETFDDEEYYGSDCKVWETDEAREQRKDRTFATLEKLEMRWNKLYDSTYLKESYAYDIFRSEGVLAPRCNIGALTWSGARMGIYTVEEPVDKIFIERNLPEEEWGGDLYKLGWTNEGATFTNTNSIGVEDEDKGAFFVYDLKTNKKKSTHETLKNMINTLNSGNVTKSSFASVVDVDNFLSFAAVSYFMGNGDDLRNNYNNCYMYFLKSSGKAVFIPYDFDRCLGVNREFNPSGHSMTKDNPYGEGNQKSPLFRYSVDNGGFYTSEYTQVLLRVAENELLTPEAFADRFAVAEKLYSNLVTPERTLKNAEGRDFRFDLNRTGSASGGSNMSFADYITAKMTTFRGYMGQSDPTGAKCYIRGDFNGWSIDSNYAMTWSGDLLVYRLSMSNSFSFKVYNDQDSTWMGAECISEDTTVSYNTDGHSNINLSSGTYQIIYDPANRTITITK